jgi:hypothetical protein
MTFHEFITIPQEQQFDIVCEKGFLIGERHDKHNSYSLYTLCSFYVELKYQKKSLEDLYCFSNGKCLEPYGQKVVRKTIRNKVLHNFRYT